MPQKRRRILCKSSVLYGVKYYGVEEVHLHTFFTLASHGYEWSASFRSVLLGERTSCIPWTGYQMGPRSLWTFLVAKNVLAFSGIEGPISDWPAITIVTVCTELIIRLMWRGTVERIRMLGALMKLEYSGFPIEIRNHSKVQFYQQGLHFCYHTPEQILFPPLFTLLQQRNCL